MNFGRNRGPWVRKLLGNDTAGACSGLVPRQVCAQNGTNWMPRGEGCTCEPLCGSVFSTGEGAPDCSTPAGECPSAGGCSAEMAVLTVHNASHLSLRYVLNNNGSVFDEWTIVQPEHGPFV